MGTIIAVLLVLVGVAFVASALPAALGRRGRYVRPIPWPVGLAVAVVIFSVSLRLLTAGGGPW